MSIEVIRTCPFGHTCEEARDGKIYRCWLYEEYGKGDSQGNIIPGSEYRACTLNMQSVHATEIRKGVLGVQQAVENRVNTLINVVDNPTIRRLTNGDEASKGRYIGSEDGGQQRLLNSNQQERSSNAQ